MTARKEKTVRRPTKTQLEWTRHTRNSWSATIVPGAHIAVSRSPSWKSRLHVQPRPWRIEVLGDHFIRDDGHESLEQAQLAAEWHARAVIRACVHALQMRVRLRRRRPTRRQAS